MRDRRVGTEDKDLATHVAEGQAATGQDPYADDYFFYRYDIRGSVTNIVDGEGAVVKSYDYDEFGVTTSTGDTFFNEPVKKSL